MQKHVSSERQRLQLIRASAGSGKTHRLTGEYLRLLFSSPDNYRRILAVTFTNKATDEMKSRIVEELHKLSAGEKSTYLAELMDKFSLNELQTHAQAKIILETILHDYSAFSISTIDRFFQQTMRAFTREMGLAGGYNVEVDDSAVVPEIIDMMLFELDKPENKQLAHWLLDFMQDKIQNDKGWNIKQDIERLAKQIFNEKYKSLSAEDKEKIHDKKHLAEYRKKLQKIVRSYEKELKELGEKAVNIMDRFGLTFHDFKWGATSGFGIFPKLANGSVEKPSNRLINLADNIDLWFGKQKHDAVSQAYSTGLNNCVNELISLSNNDLFYSSAKAVLNFFYTLGILNDIQKRLSEYQKETNTLFLSDTTELLNRIISGSDAPFIYEKIGTRIQHFMIDEFQDTSAMQWDNFRPLMSESLANNQFNLIVGDVKQSIYRWRNSDWRLLEEQVTKDFTSENIVEHSLDTNWRSDANIIAFNNALFRTGARNLQDEYNTGIPEDVEPDFTTYARSKIEDAYTHVYQHIPKNKTEKEGYVKLTFLNTEDKENDWKQQSLEQLPAVIESLQDQGFALRDIAVVVRKNDEAALVAERLLNYADEHPQSPYRYDIISNEALVIGNAQSVKAIIAFMRHLQNRKDDTKKMLAVYEFYRFHRKFSPEMALTAYLGNQQADFPEEIRAQLENIVSLPFYEMIEAFFALSEDALDENENAYIQAFLDVSLKFGVNSSSDINNFLEWWDKKGYRKTLFSPDDQDAIRLITIHKSKGLGFGAVVMPFLDWDFDHKTTQTNILWCRPNCAPFNDLGVVPVRYAANLVHTIFCKDYLEEKLYTHIDNLNLLYVAFTRAKRRIIGFTPKPKEGKKENPLRSVSDLLWKTFSGTGMPTGNNNPEKLIPLPDYLRAEGEEAVFEFGTPASIVQKDDKNAAVSCETGKWQSIPFADRLKLRLNGIGFFTDNGSRDYGTMMHEIISRIETLNDIPNAVEKRVLAGELGKHEKENIIRELTAFLSLPEVAHWYSGEYTVLNEMQVLHPRFGFSRPDRVMLRNSEAVVVDYKFGEAEDAKHVRQVRRYVKQMQEMGYENVRGFVFYAKLNKVQEVV